MPTPIPKKILARQNEITTDYLVLLETHLQSIISQKTTKMLEVRDFASMLFIHPTHLSNTIKLTTGKSPCDFYEEKIVIISKKLLEENKLQISEIAILLTYDPSNFTKFFKRFVGLNPKQYREEFLMRKIKSGNYHHLN